MWKLVKVDNKAIKKTTKKYICKVCEKEFELFKKNKYIVRENKGINGAVSGTKQFECFDCPKCGCQNVVNVREG